MRAFSLTSLAAIAILAACSETTAPPEPNTTSLETAGELTAKAVQTWTVGTLAFDNTTPIPCLGEDVRFFGTFGYKTHVVLNAAGGVSSVDLLAAATPKNEDESIAVGLTSGAEWRARGSVDPVRSRLGPGEAFHFTARERWKSDTAPSFVMKIDYFFVLNANGELSVEMSRYDPICTG